MKKNLIVLGLMLAVLLPVLASAQVGIVGSTSGNCQIGASGDVLGVLCRIGQIINAIVPVLIALGVLYFVWGVITYVIASDEEAKKAGRDRMVFGIIGLAVIIGVWGLVNFLRNTFGLNNNQNIQLPTVPVVLPVPNN